MDGFFKSTHFVVGGLALALVLGSSSRHLLCVSVRNVEQDTGTLLTAVRAVDGNHRQIKTERQSTWLDSCMSSMQVCKQNRSFHSPDWLIGLVTDVEAPPLELDDVTFFQILQTGISKHLLLQLRK